MQNEAFSLPFTPFPKQREFFLSEAKFTAYGGARGGGKSFALRHKLVLLCLKYSGIRILLLRRSYPELRENHIKPLITLLCGEKKLADYHEKDKCFTFLTGSVLLLGYLSDHGDLLRYQGLQFDVIAIDEATQIDEEMFGVLSASMRGANSFPKRMYLTCNPGGIGHGWVKRLFIDRVYRDGEDPKDYRFIPASVYDNEALMREDPDYALRLSALPEPLRSAWLHGSWDVFSGQFFSEFDPRAHVILSFIPPKEARTYCAIDYGLDMLAALFIAVLPDGRAVCYDEIYEAGLIASQAAERVKGKLRESMTVIAPADLWSRNRDSGRSTADIFAASGVFLTKLSPSRIDGWLALKEWLYTGNGEAGLRITRACPNLIRTLPLLQHDPARAGDTQNEPHEITHAPDALRYFALFCPYEKRDASGKSTLFRKVRGNETRKEKR